MLPNQNSIIIATHQYVNGQNDAKAITGSATEDVLSMYNYDVRHVSSGWDYPLLSPCTQTYALFLTGHIVLKFIYIKNRGNVKKMNWREGIEDVGVHHGLAIGFSWYLENNFCLCVCFL